MLILTLGVILSILVAMQFESYRRTQRYHEYTQQQLKRTHQQLQKLQKRFDAGLYDKTIKIISPPSIIPPQFFNEYTMNGKIRIEECYFDDTYPPQQAKGYRKEEINSLIRQVKKGTLDYYNEVSTWLGNALRKYPIRNKNVVIMGSDTPRCESICLCHGGICTTIEYNKIVSEDPRLKVLTPDEYNRNPVIFDAAFSISSFEHDGLGRYGDPLNPNGDLEAMQKMKLILKPKGILFLAVPIGTDTLVWNAHRIYGKIRLPLLLKGWKILDSFGFDEKFFDQEGADRQPIFVLENINRNWGES